MRGRSCVGFWLGKLPCKHGIRVVVLEPQLAMQQHHEPVSFLSLSVSLQSVFNVKPEEDDESEEQKEKKHKTFVEKYEKQIKHFGKLASCKCSAPWQSRR